VETTGERRLLPARRDFLQFRHLARGGRRSTYRAYGSKPRNEQSHGEAFLALFQNRFEDGIYLLDEPEAALSPARQLGLLRILHDLTAGKRAQLMIATHSPILLTFPGATVLLLEDPRIKAVPYQETEHYRLPRGFLEAPERFYRFLLTDDDANGDSQAHRQGLDVCIR